MVGSQPRIKRSSSCSTPKILLIGQTAQKYLLKMYTEYGLLIIQSFNNDDRKGIWPTKRYVPRIPW